ncbi:hypothetical protein SteCoe_32489 [Stentor coeruleus]|uniref:Uncharacterized protein n=1 Tax=Stentor coeruleus TaxID=5963 RepID=A0A1R2AYW0_9CILI|nr:hypothetical protein SteCoe_32489 [Stentor coeruleus]
MTSLGQKEKIILAKYMRAVDVRETRKSIRDTLELMKLYPKLKLYNLSKHQLELENSLADAWRAQQQRQSRMNRASRLNSIDQATELYKKIQKQAKEQDEKLIRRALPARPKLDPLPYLKKMREKLSKSMALIDSPTPKRSPTPEDTFITKRLQFELVGTERKSALQRQNTKKFYTDIKSKV